MRIVQAASSPVWRSPSVRFVSYIRPASIRRCPSRWPSISEQPSFLATRISVLISIRSVLGSNPRATSIYPPLRHTPVHEVGTRLRTLLNWLDIYRVRSSIFGYSGVLTDYGVRGLGLLGWLPLTGPASYIHSLLGDLASHDEVFGKVWTMKSFSQNLSVELYEFPFLSWFQFSILGLHLAATLHQLTTDISLQR